MVGGSTENIPPYQYENAVNLFEREIAREYSWFIEYKSKMIGVCRLNLNRTKDAARYSIGIYDDSLYSKGIGTKVTNKVLEYAFDVLNLTFVELIVLEFNKRAIRCYEKCGFTQVEVLRDSLEVDGTFHNDIRMIIKKEKQ